MITDHLPVLERAIRDKAARGERLKQVFLLLDVDLLGERPSTNRNPQTHLHPDLTGEDPVRFWVRYLTAIQFRAWRDDVRRASLPKGADARRARCRRAADAADSASRRSGRCHCRCPRSRCASPRGPTISASSR